MITLLVCCVFCTFLLVFLDGLEFVILKTKKSEKNLLLQFSLLVVILGVPWKMKESLGVLEVLEEVG